MALLPFAFDPNSIPPGFSFDNLPPIPAMDYLKSKRQWVAWKYVERDGRWTKPPVNPHTNGGASHSSPQTWSTYDHAVQCAQRHNHAGVGYVLTDNDGISGADLDNCRDAETGDIDEWANELLSLAETYWEISPSGTGFRILWLGKVDDTYKADPVGVEVYRSQRYLTITGQHVAGTPDEILPAPQTAAALRKRVDEWRAEQDANRGVDYQPQPARSQPASSGNSGQSDFFANVKTRALQSLESWVPALFSSARFQPGTGAYRISSRSLGRNLQEDLSISPKGIRDFGIHDMGDPNNGNRTAIDLVMEYGGAPDAVEAAKWLCDRMGVTPESLGWGDCDDNAELGAKLAAQILEAPITKAPMALDSVSLGHGVDWTRPEGLLADISDWIMASSRRPNRPLAVAAAVAVLSAACGRHLFGPTGTALNVYIVCLAGTAVGKNRPLGGIAEILRAAKLDMLHTTAKAFSVSAIEQMVIDFPCCVATIDEIGANLLSRMSNKFSSTHEAAMRGALMELWSREQGMPPFSTHRRAGSAPTSIPSPNLTLFGASTPEAFYSAITSGSVRDGFLNRFLLAPAAPRAKPVEVSEDARRVPQRLCGALLDLIPQPASGNLSQCLGVFSIAIEPDSTRIGWDSPAVKERAEAFEEELLEIIDHAPDQAPFMGRIFEYSIRLAALHAVSRAGRSAKVTAQDLAWGSCWAMQSARAMIDGANSLMAANDYEAKMNIVSNIIKEEGFIGQRDLLRRVRSVTKRERDEIIKHLADGGWIEHTTRTTRGRPAVGYRWVG